MKTRAIAVLFALLIPAAVMAQANFSVNADEMTAGFMNVFNLPEDGSAFQFASGWGIADLTAVFDGAGYSNVTLSPNTIGDPNEYWYQCLPGNPGPNCGEPGAPGNKIMEANLYGEMTDALAGQTVTFSGEVLSTTLTGAHVVKAFIRDFAPDFSSFNESVVVLNSTGLFSISLAADPGAGRHVQWGFQMTGVNVWSTDVGAFGTMVIGPDPAVPNETSSWSDLKASYR